MWIKFAPKQRFISNSLSMNIPKKICTIFSCFSFRLGAYDLESLNHVIRMVVRLFFLLLIPFHFRKLLRNASNTIWKYLLGRLDSDRSRPNRCSTNNTRRQNKLSSSRVIDSESECILLARGWYLSSYRKKKCFIKIFTVSHCVWIHE